MPNATKFPNALVVITGAGRPSQLGETLAAHFAATGFSLALIGRTLDEAQARTAELTASPSGQRFTAHAADLASPAAAESVAAEVLLAHKTSRVHAVVCVAGGFGATGPLDEADPDAWHQQFAINVDTAFATTRAFLPALREAKGSLVYFGSASALPGGSPKGLAAYAAAKSGVLALMRTVALDEKAHGVRANAVAPTAIRTATNLADMGDKTFYVERESVADVVAFLVSPAARNITGQVITLA
ncbi:putative oxidoreductase [Gemmatimonas aurantiaca T-27]|nr:SDR family oxidoreductase [Gemmatimonas aurantiaca]BAH37218.1 putative oxidoreductase [Gemmatimonas aurantiaca T-27]